MQDRDIYSYFGLCKLAVICLKGHSNPTNLALQNMNTPLLINIPASDFSENL